MAVTTSGTDVIRAAVDAINRHDTQGLRALWAPGLRERFPNAECSSPDEAAAYFQAGFDAMPDLRIEILAMAEERETVFMRWRMTGTHSGAPWSGIAPTGKPIELEGIDHFTVRDGKIEEAFVVFDQLQFARAVGFVPPDGSPADRAMKAAFAGRVKLAGKLRR